MLFVLERLSTYIFSQLQGCSDDSSSSFVFDMYRCKGIYFITCFIYPEIGSLNVKNKHGNQSHIQT